MFCVPTPYSLINDDDDPVDVFEEIFPQYIDPDDISLGEYPYWEEKRETMWARFHDTGLGNADVDYWIRCMKGRAADIEARYAVRFRVWSEFQTRLAAASEVDLADSSMESESVQKHYDPPQTSTAGAEATSYLDQQDVNHFSQNTHGGMEPETVRDYNRAIENPFEEYAREFDKLFYWGM